MSAPEWLQAMITSAAENVALEASLRGRAKSLSENDHNMSSCCKHLLIQTRSNGTLTARLLVASCE